MERNLRIRIDLLHTLYWWVSVVDIDALDIKVLCVTKDGNRAISEYTYWNATLRDRGEVFDRLISIK